MGLALRLARGTEPPGAPRRWNAWGILKYGACLVGASAALVAALAVPGGLLWSPAAVLAFYAVEAQMVFLFPVLLDGAPRPLRSSRALCVSAGGTISVMATVLPIAAAMLFGGFLGRGFLRSWSVGCLAVVLWYEAVRA